jgi:polyribonucleotide nucleotidyltransferase
MSYIREIEVGGRKLKVILGKTARQADGAAWIQYGDAVMHIAVVSEHKRREGMDFLPLTVDYRERYYAGGKIPGGFFKREGRPQEKEILSARIIDRPIRPLFPDGYAYETQVMAVILSADKENDADILGPTAASIALNISDIPMNEIIAAVRVGLIDGKYIVNPIISDLEKSRLNLVMVGSEKAITMVEGHAKELSNQELIDALAFGHVEIRKLVEFQREIVKDMRKPTREYEIVEKDAELGAKVKEIAEPVVKEIARIKDKTERSNRKDQLIDLLLEQLGGEDPDAVKGDIKEFVKDILKIEVRQNILRENIRLDGRTCTDIRPIECELGLLPRVHGSALFTRGQTQALGTVTLGSKLDEQRIDDLDEEGFRKYMLHYNFPPYSTGEVKNSFGVSRREVGHGKLGERAIEPLLPDWDDFPYTIRIVSEILESNGSSSMASVCAGSLALMDAGVPLKKPVAGIAMGLIKEGDDHAILTDILGDEDHLGDMDFKVAGTRDGITAFQMDIKIEGISAELMAEAMAQAENARRKILDIMDATIDKPRLEVSPYAPKFITIKIPVDRIGALIGPGGKNIREIVSDTGATIDIEDDGTVRIGAPDSIIGAAARKRVEAITEVPEVNKVYDATVKRIMDFGAFVEIIPGTEGLLHISQIDHKRVNQVTDVLNVGDKVKVKLLKIEPDGKLDLSRKALLPDNRSPEEKAEAEARAAARPPRRDGFKPRSGGSSGGGGRGPRR